VPTYNRADSLNKCLAALERQEGAEGQYEVVVVVDGSTDGTLEEVSRRWERPWIRWLAVPHGGASAARNAGIEVARGVYVALTEDDVVPDMRWLAVARQRILESGADVLEGATVYPGGSHSVRKLEPPGIPSFVPCNLFVRRSLFGTVGVYDPAFFDPRRELYFREDADLGFRLMESGANIIQADDVKVTHPRQFTTVGGCLRHARRYVFDALLYRRHPHLYRKMIEVKELLGVRIHRPQHYVAIVYGIGAVALPVSLALGNMTWAMLTCVVVLCCAFLFRVKYHGRRAFELSRFAETGGFLVLPGVYLYAVVSGALKYRAPGVLL
jgi:GT2 family glycosyltransferase